MSRVQLALNVSDLDAGRRLLLPAVRHRAGEAPPGYANFAIAEPPLKLVLFENAAATTRSTTSASRSSRPTRSARPSAASPAKASTTTEEDEVSCCYAVQDKVWVDDPDGVPWEIYTVLDDAPDLECTVCGTTC